MVHPKCFRFCFVIFLFCILGFNIIAQTPDFEYFVDIALKNSITYNKALTNYSLNKLQVFSTKTRYVPTLFTSFNYASSFDSSLKDAIHTLDNNTVLTFPLPIGMKLSINANNNLTLLQVGKIQNVYSFSGTAVFSAPMHFLHLVLLSIILT